MAMTMFLDFNLSLHFEGMFLGGVSLTIELSKILAVNLKVSWSANFPIKCVKGYGKSSKFSEKIYLVWRYIRGKR